MWASRPTSTEQYRDKEPSPVPLSCRVDIIRVVTYTAGMHKMLTISEAARELGVSVSTLRRWDHTGRLKPEKTAAGHRRYDISKLKPGLYRTKAQREERKTIAYARVSGDDQAEELERQKRTLEAYCAQQGWTYEVIGETGAGANHRKSGVRRLLNDIINDRAGRLVITHKDRLLRFGADLILAVCEAKNVEFVILNRDEDAIFEEDLSRDVLDVVDTFSARLYGARSRKSKKMMESIMKAIEIASKQ